jgi:hypothetical protein
MNNKVLTLAGAVVLIIGLFLPIASIFGISTNILMPPGESISGPGIILLACAVLGGILALINQTKFAVLPAVGALGFLVWKYMELKNGLDTATAGAGASAEMSAAISELASINILGWAVMGVGALIMLVGSAMAWKSSPTTAA